LQRSPPALITHDRERDGVLFDFFDGFFMLFVSTERPVTPSLSQHYQTTLSNNIIVIVVFLCAFVFVAVIMM
jgi:hypothetical protein